LKALRLKAGLSQRELAQGLVTKSMISQIESGRVQPSRELLGRLAERLGVTFADLLPVKQQEEDRLTHYRKGQAFFELGHVEEAEALFRECLAAPHPSWSRAELTLWLARCAQRLQRLAEARELLEEALRLEAQEENEGCEVRAEIWRRLGELSYAAGEYGVAAEEWKRAYELLQEAAGGERLAVSLGLGRACHALGRHVEAVRYYREARAEVIAGRGSRRLLAEVEHGLGLLIEQGSQAEAHLRVAEKLYEGIGDWRRLDDVRAQLALLGGAGGAWELERLVELVRTRPEGSRVRGVAERLLAEAYLRDERLELAREWAERAWWTLHAEGREEESLAVVQVLTEVYKRMGEYRQASEWATCATEIQRQLIRRRGWLV
jgi:transcriptional regulator with XRE-family HTH domain